VDAATDSWVYKRSVAIPATRKEQILIAGACVVLVVIVGIVGWSLLHPAPAPQQEAAAAPVAPPAKDAGSPSLPAEAPAAGPPEFVGPEELVGPPAPPPAPARSRPTAVRSANRPAPQPLSPPNVAPPPDLPAARSREEAAPAAAPSRSSDATPTASAPPAPAYLPPGAGVTYTAADADVTPPAAITPQLVEWLSLPSPGNRPEVMMIAVLVNPNGTVDSVRAVNVPVSLGESVMLTAALSAVKSWRFHPATKDGAPVRYRQIVPVRIAPGSFH
jgi:TonB family protein